MLVFVRYIDRNVFVEKVCEPLLVLDSARTPSATGDGQQWVTGESIDQIIIIHFSWNEYIETAVGCQ